MSTPRETAIETGASQGIGAGNVKPADNRLTAGDEIPAGAGVIEVHVRELSQLFNSMDPSPFLDKDLDVDAEEFITAWARELPRDKPLALLVHLDQPLVEPRQGAMLRDSVHAFYTHRAEMSYQRLR